MQVTNLSKILPSLFVFLLSAPALATTYLPVPNVEAKAYIVYDVRNNRIILEKNSESQLPLASLTKLMTIYSAYKEGVVDERESCFTLVTSSNEEAESISKKTKTGVMGMNTLASDLKMRQTFYLNPSGLDLTTTFSGAYGSARDMAILVSAIYHDYPTLMRCTTEKIASLGDVTRPNTNTSIDKIIGIVGSKTGFTDLAGGNLAIIFDAGISEPIVIVVLGSSQEGRFADTKALSLYAINYISER